MFRVLFCSLVFVAVQAAIHECTSFEDNKNILDAAGSKSVALYFTAQWCGPCRVMTTLFSKTQQKYSDSFEFINVDSDNCPDVAEEFGIRALPVLIIVKNGQRIDEIYGPNIAGYDLLLKKYA